VYYGVARAGLIAVPLNFHLGPIELAMILGSAEPSAVLYHSKLAEVARGIREHATLGCTWLVVGGRDDGAVAYAVLSLAAASTPPDNPVAENDPCTTIYTSGATRQPKELCSPIGAC
jgi:acyl-CoA synthetase (AMP-forming)/AMP-acid ligase II